MIACYWKLSQVTSTFFLREIIIGTILDVLYTREVKSTSDGERQEHMSLTLFFLNIAENIGGVRPHIINSIKIQV